MTEIYVHEPSSREDLRQLVLSYLHGTAVAPPADAVVDFYQAAKSAAVHPTLLVCGTIFPPGLCPKHV